jgi:predicted PurR-regulated permease PerM
MARTPQPTARPDLTVHTIRNSLVVLMVIGTGAALLWLRPILTPLMLALFLMVLVDELARRVHRRLPALGPGASLAVALVILLVVFAALGVFVFQNASNFVGELMTRGPKLGSRIGGVIAGFGIKAPPRVLHMLNRLDPTVYIGPVAVSAQNVIIEGVLTAIYLGFLLASRSGIGRKIVTLFPTHERREQAGVIFERIRVGIERYVWVQTITGLLIAACAWALMAWLGLDNATFWALFIFLTSYVPMIGAAVGILAPVAYALLQFNSPWIAVGLLAGLEAIMFVIGNMLLPRMQGRSLNLDPVVLLLSLAFWSALWGLPGAFLSSPLTVMAMVILAQFPSTHWIAVLLSGDGEPT